LVVLKRYIYFFNDVKEVEERCHGSEDGVRALLGGKGIGLAVFARLGIPVPNGFTITTEACNDYYKQSPPAFPPGLWEAEEVALKRLEKETGKQFGSDTNPLLVSCRSGAKISMPGMMDTVLNIGLNDKTVQAMIKLTQNPRFVYDSYRRLLQGYGAIVLAFQMKNSKLLLRTTKPPTIVPTTKNAQLKTGLLLLKLTKRSFSRKLASHSHKIQLSKSNLLLLPFSAPGIAHVPSNIVTTSRSHTILEQPSTSCPWFSVTWVTLLQLVLPSPVTHPLVKRRFGVIS